MCGTGYRTCGICANAGGCLAGMREDYFVPASKEKVKERIKNGSYNCDRKIMDEYLSFLDNNVQPIDFIKAVFGT